MTLKLKDCCRYECDPEDWRLVLVCYMGDMGDSDRIVEFRTDGGEEITLGRYDENGKLIGCDTVPCLIPENWEYRAHSELTVRGWFSPWEVV